MQYNHGSSWSLLCLIVVEMLAENAILEGRKSKNEFCLIVINLLCKANVSFWEVKFNVECCMERDIMFWITLNVCDVIDEWFIIGVKIGSAL